MPYLFFNFNISKCLIRLLCPAFLVDLPLRQKGGAEKSVLLLITGRLPEEVEKNQQARPGEWLFEPEKVGREATACVLPSLQTGTNQDEPVRAHL